MKKATLLFCTVLMAVSLSGCCIKHNWVEATCTEPKTCSRCGETEGDPLGHEWVDATCTEAKTCSVCGATDGDPLGHDWVDATCTEPKKCSVCGLTDGEPLGHEFAEANYQQPSKCIRCDETQGEKLVASFEEHGLEINATLDRPISYKTCCYDNAKKETVGSVRFSDFQCFKGNDYLPEKDGYVWMSIFVTVDYTDENAWNYGFRTGRSFEDYYTIEENDASMVWHDSISDVPNDLKPFCERMSKNGMEFLNYVTFVVNHNGNDYSCEMIQATDAAQGWITKKHGYWGWHYYMCVPEGYDGRVLVFYHKHGENDWPGGKYIYDIADEDTIFFRMDPKLAQGGDL